MDFWDWANEGSLNEYTSGLEQKWIFKNWFLNQLKYLFFCFVIFGIPIIIYFFVKWDPIIKYNKDGPTSLGPWVVLILYWIGLSYTWKRHRVRQKLNTLLDILIYKDKKELDILIENAKKQNIINQEKKEVLKEIGEDRIRWFDIK